MPNTHRLFSLRMVTLQLANHTERLLKLLALWLKNVLRISGRVLADHA